MFSVCEHLQGTGIGTALLPWDEHTGNSLSRTNSRTTRPPAKS